MPLSPEMRTKFLELTGADKSASEDALFAAVATELDARKKDITTLGEKAKSVAALSADVQRLTAELKTAKDEAHAKAEQVVALSANAPRKMDPLDLAELAEQFDQKAESAVAGGAPEKAVAALHSLFKAPDGNPSVLALSACPVLGSDGKTTRQKRVGIAVMDVFERAFRGEYGDGVPVGQARPAGTKLLKLSADGDAEKADPAEVERMRKLSGLPAKA